jgi:hypothetical protein
MYPYTLYFASWAVGTPSNVLTLREDWGWASDACVDPDEDSVEDGSNMDF